MTDAGIPADEDDPRPQTVAAAGVAPAPVDSDPLTLGPPKRPHVFRRLYDWTLSWADTPYGTPALFTMSFAEASFFPIPPDVLQLALSVGRPARSLFYAAVSTVGSVLGAVLGWTIGLVLWTTVDDFFYRWIPGFTPELFAKVSDSYQENAFLALSLAAITIIPFKIFTIAAGACGVSLWTLVVASTLARGFRFGLVGCLIYFFGPKIKELIDRYFEIVAVAFAVLLVAGLVLVKTLH